MCVYIFIIICIHLFVCVCVCAGVCEGAPAPLAPQATHYTLNPAPSFVNDHVAFEKASEPRKSGLEASMRPVCLYIYIYIYICIYIYIYI